VRSTGREVGRTLSAQRALALALCSALFGCLSLFPPRNPPTLDADLVQRGARLFVDPAVSGDKSRACATCHPGGATDHRFYREGEPVAAGAEGARRPLALRGAWQTGPYLWDGSARSIDAAIERMLRVEMRGAALGAEERAALAAYVLSIPRFESGLVAADGSPIGASATASEGWAVFQRAECTVCHAPPSYTAVFRFDVGTGGKLSVPTLRGLSQSPGPYGHDGRWATLEQAVAAIAKSREVQLSEQDIASLVAYLRLL
jgi:cytochrome c peroxidase